MLTEQQINLFWANLIKGNQEIKTNYNKVIIDNQFTLKNDIYEKFLQKISEIPPNLLTEEDIDLLYDLSRCKSASLQTNSLQILQKFLMDYNELTQEKCELILKKYSKLIKDQPQEEKIAIMKSCIKNIKKDTSPLISIKIILEVLQN
eukprot:TRINITY_DN23683_c0_g1_i1.p2 TRINITY_DN23683_c0_g1~~TRINITY_DN23683_c0_g1_i1.p2  ORF type:complete len:148 (-),score=24.67 TRINITY_DN23683_c0_g1_i1:127-570(-)